MSDASVAGKTALITGASSGIGYELAKVCAREGFGVVLVARDAGQLAQVADELRGRHRVMASVLPADLTQPAAPEQLFAQVQQQGLTIDLLVNNAGFGTYGLFAEADLRTQLEMLQVNLVALTHLTRLFLPGMVARGWGRVLNVASTAAFQPGPLMAVYYASKAYVLSLSEALANELRGSGVTVTALCPGPTRTNFQDRAGVGHTKLMSGRIMEAQTVAEAGYRGVLRGIPVVVPGMRNRLLTLVVRLLPRSVVAQIVRQVQEKRQRV